jgi:hypothetical protein
VNPARDLAGAATLALGVALGGLFVGSGFARARAADRFVAVKGISEREVRADLAIWPLHLVAADNDLSRAHAQIESSVSRIRAFLASIAEATARARESAEQFAKDSHSDIGGIRSASQGVFEILPRDQAQGISEASQIVKTVRVVSTIDYSLKN